MEEEPSLFRSLVEWVVILVLALGLTLLMREFVILPFTVPTGSMETTILVGDNIFAEKVTLELGQPAAVGDIVVFKSPDTSSAHETLVKRVIAKAGQTVDFQNGKLLVDGEVVEEDFTQGSSYPLPTTAPGVDISYPYTVPEGCLWMMGDNRENSADSRYFGAVPEENLIGVAVFRYWPLDRIGTL